MHVSPLREEVQWDLTSQSRTIKKNRKGKGAIKLQAMWFEGGLAMEKKAIKDAEGSPPKKSSSDRCVDGKISWKEERGHIQRDEITLPALHEGGTDTRLTRKFAPSRTQCRGGGDGNDRKQAMSSQNSRLNRSTRMGKRRSNQRKTRHSLMMTDVQRVRSDRRSPDPRLY